MNWEQDSHRAGPLRVLLRPLGQEERLELEAGLSAAPPLGSYWELLVCR